MTHETKLQEALANARRLLGEEKQESSTVTLTDARRISDDARGPQMP